MAKETPDEELMAQVKEGKEEAFTLLVSRHQHLVYGTIAHMIGGAGPDAEDLSQQVFIRVYRAAARYRPEAKFTTWLLTICRNMVFTHCKRQKLRRLFTSSSQANEDEGEEKNDWLDPQIQTARDELLQKELEKNIRLALSKLPEKQRMSLILRQYQQLDYEQIAKVLQTTVPSVKSLLFRARETLKTLLKPYLDATLKEEGS